MFQYSKMELARLAKELNFIRDTLEKVIRLSEILDYINSNPIMKHRLALKGGTAINLTVFNLPRLSIDIDLDYCLMILLFFNRVKDHYMIAWKLQDHNK